MEMVTSQFIPGNIARWCIDCDGCCAEVVCPACGSEHTWSLRAWLDREESFVTASDTSPIPSPAEPADQDSAPR